MATVTCFALTGAGDLAYENGSFQLAEDTAAVSDMLKFGLNKVQGDWFLDLQEGLDYFGAIFGKKAIDLELVSEYKVAILDVTGITAIKAFSATFGSGRNLLVDFTARTIFSTPEGEGDIIFKEEVNPIG